MGGLRYWSVSVRSQAVAQVQCQVSFKVTAFILYSGFQANGFFQSHCIYSLQWLSSQWFLSKSLHSFSTVAFKPMVSFKVTAFILYNLS
jgi:hypothetical protein